MNDKLLVSVIIPIYNAQNYIAECIDSVLSQTYSNFEMILIDDGSSDESLSICRDYAAKDLRIKLFSFHNAGVSVARNRGLEVASGELCCFIDSDDVVQDDYLETLISCCSSNDVDVVFCNHSNLYGNHIVSKASRLHEGLYDSGNLKSIAIDDATLTGILFGSVCCALYRTDLLKSNGLEFIADIKVNEDGIYNLHVLECAKHVYVSEYAGYLYRQDSKNNRREFCWNVELDKSNDYILRTFSDFDDFDIQYRHRLASVFFWNGLSAADSCTSSRELVKIFENHYEQYLGAGNCTGLNANRYKSLLFHLLFRRHYYLFFVLVRYFVPILSRILNH